jgi:hypothetical protein
VLELQLGLGQADRQRRVRQRLVCETQVVVATVVRALRLGGTRRRQVVQQRRLAVVGTLQQAPLGLGPVTLGVGQQPLGESAPRLERPPATTPAAHALR